MDAELKQYLEAMEKRLKEHFQSTETKLLTAFYEWARPQEMGSIRAWHCSKGA